MLIIGAGPTGLFCAHQLGIIGLQCEIVDNLDKAGGQCIELYPDKPIYDIPAVPECTGEELTNNLLQQIKPFNIKFHLNERVEELKKVENRWHVKTSGNQEFDVAAIIIAGGVGSFEPRKFSVKECEKFEGSSLFYSIKDKTIFNDKTISIFGGGDSALDWAIELSNSFFPLVLTCQRFSTFFSSSTLSFKWNLILNGLICWRRLFVNSSPVHSGTAGIS